MTDFRDYEENTINTKNLKGEECIFYLYEDFNLDLDIDSLDELLRKSLRLGQDIATADLLDDLNVSYAPDSLECEELFACEYDLLASECEVKEYLLNTIKDCLDTESIKDMLGDEPMKSEFVNEELDSLCRDHRLGQEQYSQYDTELSDYDLEGLL